MQHLTFAVNVLCNIRNIWYILFLFDNIVLLSVTHGRVRVLKISSYLDTESRSSQPKPDEVKMVLYVVEECGMPCFSLAVAEGQMYIRTAEVRPY